ncbi:MAG TPA: hypothetical protein VGR23_05715 [Candidatus Dormibacteraeota bacterium]|nr:hypothetical protein [Candidatus Dormibacteraeota bacterium]
MRKVILALALALSCPLTALADASTSLGSSANPSYVGQTVKFTAVFFFACADGVSSHFFTIDGKAYPGDFSSVGQQGTATLSISSLKAGTHKVVFTWQTSQGPPNDISCGGSDSLTQTVRARPSPLPSPKPKPAPSPSSAPSPEESPSVPAESPSPSPSPASSARLTVDLDAGGADVVVPAWLTLSAIVLAVVLAVAGPRLAAARPALPDRRANVTERISRSKQR